MNRIRENLEFRILPKPISFVLGLVAFAAFILGCSSDEQQAPKPDCDFDGICDPHEECLKCPDCCVGCTTDGDRRYEYIVNEFSIGTEEDYDEVGVDIDDDGEIDNKMLQGALLAMYPEDWNLMFQELVQSGRYILLIRLDVDESLAPEPTAIHIFSGDLDPTHDATEDNLTGEGHARIAPDTDESQWLCGVLDDFALGGMYADLSIPFPIIDPKTVMPVVVPLQKVKVRSEDPVFSSGFNRLHVGGGMTRDTIQNIVIPAMARVLDHAARFDPNGKIGHFALQWIDADCSMIPEGCADVTYGEGECAPWDGDPSSTAITATEVRCETTTSIMFQPDVDIDGDGLKDLVSVGFMVSGVPITIDQ